MIPGRDPSQIPSLRPPPGVTPNFVDPYSRGQVVRISTAVSISLAALFVCMRIYSRAFIVRKLWWDDYTSILALLMGIAWSGVTVKYSFLGVGRHRWDVPVSLITQSLKIEMAVFVLYAPYIFFVEMSILLLYIRILGPSKVFRYLVYAAMFLVSGYTTAFFFAALFSCTPRKKYWQPTLPGSCIRIVNLAIASCAINIAVDLIILFLPVVPVWRLQLTTKQKISVLIMFTAGSIACLAAFVRMKYFVDISNSADSTWHGWGSTSWTSIEASMGLICGCLPAARPFLQHHFPILFGERTLPGSYPVGSGPRDSGRATPKPSIASSELDAIHVENKV
ncbi:MAG: hypothetical protein M1823_001094 [Watsoniomyces obsoletus]|nr:MAG: hypothetical protein M1823_001094 [Watsoniomyces obsoletus]